jgi:hypothetical protein
MYLGDHPTHRCLGRADKNEYVFAVEAHVLKRSNDLDVREAL